MNIGSMKKSQLIVYMVFFALVALNATARSNTATPLQMHHLYYDSSEANASWQSRNNALTGHQTYTVKSGDTLGSISQKFYNNSTRWREIAKANNITDPSKLRIGEVLVIPTTESKSSSNTVHRQRPRYVSSPGQNIQTAPSPSSLPAPSLPLPPVSREGDIFTTTDAGIPRILLPGEEVPRTESNSNMVSFSGLTGLVNTFAAYPLGENVFSTAFGMTWNKVSRRKGIRLEDGEDGDYWEFPILLTYAGENFEIALRLPFESYDIHAPVTYNFRDGKDSGMGDVALRLKFSSENEDMASALGLGAIFPTSDINIGNTDTNNAWEVFAGISTLRPEAGNLHLNGGYQAGDGNTAHEGVFVNLGFEYDPNDSFTFMGEVNFYNRINAGKSTDLTLGMRYHVKEGMSLTLASPIALSNDMFFGYDFRLQGMLQYHY